MSWVEAFFDDPTYDIEYAGLLGDKERTAKEAAFIIRELALSGKDRVLDLACGHGRHALEVAKAVTHVVGYDRTDHFLAHARKQAEELGVANVEFVRGDMRELDYEDEFDAAYNYFTAWGYYCDAENQDVLARVVRALRPGGRFLLEMINRDALLGDFRPRSWQELEDGTVVLVEQRFDFETGRSLTKRIYLRGSDRRTVETDVRLPAPEESVRMFRQAGFARIRLISAPEGGALTAKSWRIAVIGAKE
ncbi:MAG: class I SAM-dependent methyltransferase [Phycisphaerae bacterium]|nr:class I SAM-dependent methyltransferase [Phycisphaerae bacterium]